ncbi:hypothetical protein [Magnetofaba australis]|uniref:Uncharacterized protein n=1 Tax=Magnetofaba australis IT-1 TaxID=1434232 RepID=A0A1Y2K6B4_9PROT|nr:hypothetical protein [Magnetofaba australis]OSM05179.1 hypothetical protein MAIT1_03336 [Magnetofaba australis IT-1]
MFALNPEFRRYLWTELTPHRIVAMPLVLAGLFYLTWVTRDYQSVWNPRDAALAGFGVLIFLWGTRLAGEAVSQEVLDRTWDSQRMSVLSPWSMTWSKLTGSTIFVWYGAIICLLLFVVALQRHFPFFPQERAWQIIGWALGCGALSHAMSLLVSIVSVTKRRRINRRRVSGFQVLGLLLLAPFFFGVIYLLYTPLEAERQVLWYGRELSLAKFLLLSVWTFFAWTVLAIVRVMGEELQTPRAPLAWALFLTFLFGYGAGFVNVTDSLSEYDNLIARVAFCLPLAMALTYYAAIAESRDLMAYRLTLHHARRAQWKPFFHALPLWWITYGVSMGLLLALLFMPLSVDLVASSIIHVGEGEEVHVKWALIAAFLFMTRDIALMQMLHMNTAAKRPDLTTMLYLLVLYGLLPTAMRVMEIGGATLPLFYPMAGYDPALIVGPPLVEALVTITLAWSRWRSMMRRA